MMIRVLVIGILFQTVSMTMINSVISDISNDNIRDDVERIPTERCPVGWLMSSNNKCYVFALEPENQPDADRRCRASNGRLLALESAADQTALTTLMVDTKLFLNTTFWTAGQKATGGWSWGAAPFTFTNWAVIPNITGISELLTPQQKTTLDGYLPNKEFRLLYKASRDGMTPSAFHSRCDNKGPTVSIGVEAYTGVAYGGFTSRSWTSGRWYRSDENAFIFELCGGENCTSAKYGLGSSERFRRYATYSNYRSGPTFGMGHELNFFFYYTDKDLDFPYNTGNNTFSSNGFCYGYRPYTYSGILTCGNNVEWRDVEVYQVFDTRPTSGDCMVIGSGDQEWLREDCSTKHPYICEQD